jgi:hypothetical protein
METKMRKITINRFIGTRPMEEAEYQLGMMAKTMLSHREAEALEDRAFKARTAASEGWLVDKAGWARGQRAYIRTMLRLLRPLLRFEWSIDKYTPFVCRS